MLGENRRKIGFCWKEMEGEVAAPILIPKKRPEPNQNHPQPSNGDWNPKMWNWDSGGFTAKRVESTIDDDDAESLRLKLGGVEYSAEQRAARSSKRIRSGSPGPGTGYPMCQVDDCRANLSGAKDYHRRHKVCEVHSKTSKAVVAKKMQRFCQQCSRFHPLSEFDEGKRSCRRRLAGHNRRRRKTQQEDGTSHGSKGDGSLDVANLLAILSSVQGNCAEKPASGVVVPNPDHVIQILSKMNSLPSENMTLNLVAPACLDLNVSQVSINGVEQSSKLNGSPSVPLTMDLLAALPAALAPDSLGALSQGSSAISGEDNSKKTVHETRTSLSFQLFGSTEHDNPLRVDSCRKYLSSESSNPMDYRSPSSSPPLTRKLFPLHSGRHREDGIVTVGANMSRDWPAVPLDLFKESERGAIGGAVQSFPHQSDYASSSGSDRSPSSSNSDSQERTERILFKLFEKDPSNLPGSLRDQILSWLSNSPLEMESYIRPGCLVLSIYASMPSVAWDGFEKDFLKRVSSLVHSFESEFWLSGRFFVQTRRQLALQKDGVIQLCKYWRTWSAPELTFVSPVAVVRGQETSLLLRGRNLTLPGTKIHCTHMGGYKSKEVAGSAFPGTIYDYSTSESFTFPGGFPSVFGRCFIEVENGLKGNSFPIIIADAGICQELRALELEFEEDKGTTDAVSEGQVHSRSRDDALHFLHELGWLFQRKNTSFGPFTMDFSCTRIKFLFIFSVERDWSVLIRTLLDMLVERSLRGDDLMQESLEMLLEVQLLSRAVTRKCWTMVNLLLHYSINGRVDDSKIYLFPPNSVGPGGLTPLHLAASMLESENIVDLLTSDPQQIGLRCWSVLKDENGQSPYMKASIRNNHSYNTLVARKLLDRQNSQVSVMVGEKETSLCKSRIVREPPIACARCAIAQACRSRPNVRSQGLLQRPYVVSMLAIAAVCVCVCVFLRDSPKIGCVAPFKWENLDYGPR